MANIRIYLPWRFQQAKHRLQFLHQPAKSLCFHYSSNHLQKISYVGALITFYAEKKITLLTFMKNRFILINGFRRRVRNHPRLKQN